MTYHSICSSVPCFFVSTSTFLTKKVGLKRNSSQAFSEGERGTIGKSFAQFTEPSLSAISVSEIDCS